MDKGNGQLRGIIMKNQFRETQKPQVRRQHENFGLTSENFILKVVKILLVKFISINCILKGICIKNPIRSK